MCRATLVLTTIFDPIILDVYRRNFERYGHLDDIDVIVIPDRKTPPAALETCARMARQGLKVTCPTLDEQETYLRRAGLPAGFIPYDSDNRRNIGYLMAWERQSEFLVSIDDDNFCLEDGDYFGTHEDAFFGGQPQLIAQTESRFLNICDLLQTGTSRVYARGYPYFARHKNAEFRTYRGFADVMINAGLWLQDPDVDAITWLGLRPHVHSFKNRSLVLDSATWSPVNSQNTALRRELIPAYYFIRMGDPVSGGTIGRYGDIFSGYFALACAKHLGGTARFGTPIADHRRNSHNYLNDATAELPAIVLLEDLLAWLTEAPLSGSTGLEAYLSLSHGLDALAERLQGRAWNDQARAFVHGMAERMRIWAVACRRLAGSDGARFERSLDEDLGGNDRVFGNRAFARIGAPDQERVA
jgi:hypothetical protein